MSKIAYIPSERNILNLSKISTFQMGDNYILGFIFDWLSIRSKYSNAHRLEILNLGVDYYYVDNKGDVITLRNGNEISLSESSSGLQAVIPMLVFVDYVSKWIYENIADLSYDKYESLQRVIDRIYGQGSADSTPIADLIERIGKPHSTKLTIEEDEMNNFLLRNMSW